MTASMAAVDADAPVAEARASFEELFAEGVRLAEANETLKAREVLRAAAKLDGDGLDVQLWLCRLAYRTYDWGDLHASSKAYLAERPGDREVLLLHARACAGVGDWASAASAWEGVAEDRADWPEARYQQARALIRLGALQEASHIAAGLSELARDDARCYAIRLHLELAEFANASRAFRALFSASPNLAETELAAFEQRNDQRGLAVAVRARFAVEGGDVAEDDRALNVSEALFRRAIGHERAGDLLETFFDYDALLILSPQDGLAQRSRARIVRELRLRAQNHLAAEELPQAVAAFARAVRAAPSDIALRRTHGRTLMRLRQWPEATVAWRDFQRLAPDDPEGSLQLARALDRGGRLADALGAWRAAEGHAPENEEVRKSLSTIIRRMTFAGRAAISEERFLDAYDLFNVVRAEEPDDEEAGRRLEQVGRNMLRAMRAAYRTHDLRGVLRYADAASTLMPDDAEVQLLIGRAASGMRRHEAALAAWGRLKELDPQQSVLAGLQQARCHLHLGNAKEGQAAVREVLKADPKNPAARQISERLRSLV